MPFAHSGRDGALLGLRGATGVHRASIIAAAARNRLPAIYPACSYAADGGLSPPTVGLPRHLCRTAPYVDRVPRGEKAGNLIADRRLVHVSRHSEIRASDH